MTEEVDQKQRVLKIIVIVLGIAIIVCIGVIIVTIAMRASGKGERANAPAAMSAQVAPAKVLGNVDVPIPYAAKVVQVTGGAAELYVLVDLPDGQRQLLLVDRATGGVLGTLRFAPGAAPALAPAP
jgi:hypothetical protein